MAIEQRQARGVPGLAADLASGGAPVGIPANFGTAYLKTVSDIMAGSVSMLRFLPGNEYAAIRARTSTYDATTAFNNAITEMNAVGGGVIDIPYGTWLAEGIVLRSGVHLRGAGAGFTDYTRLATQIRGRGQGGDILTGPGTQVVGAGLHGLFFRGEAGLNSRGVNLSSALRVPIDGCTFRYFQDEGLRIAGGNACHLKNLMALNCVANTTRAAKIGAVYVAGADHWLHDCEITASVVGAKTHASLYVVACLWAASSSHITGNVFELSDVGLHLTGSHNRLTGIRADLNWGHGFELVGAGANMLEGCHALSNSQDANNTYDGFSTGSGSQRNLFVGCIANSLTANKHRYGFDDAVNSDAGKNYYFSSRSENHATRSFNTVGFAGSAVSFTEGPPKTFAAADTTPSVDGYGQFRTGDTTAYTNFDDGVSGQQITILASHAATLTNNATIKTTTGANVTMTVNRRYRLTNWQGVWYQDY